MLRNFDEHSSAEREVMEILAKHDFLYDEMTYHSKMNLQSVDRAGAYCPICGYAKQVCIGKEKKPDGN